MYTTLTLYKQTEIEIEMPIFIEHILKLYRSKRPIGDGRTFNNEICAIIEDMTIGGEVHGKNCRSY